MIKQCQNNGKIVENNEAKCKSHTEWDTFYFNQIEPSNQTAIYRLRRKCQADRVSDGEFFDAPFLHKWWNRALPLIVLKFSHGVLVSQSL